MMYDAAFPDLPEGERITKIATSLALGAVVCVVTSSEAPFQQFLRFPVGTEADLRMSDEALAGAVLFFGEGDAITGGRYTNDVDPLPIETPDPNDPNNPGNDWVGKTMADDMNAVLLYPDRANLGRSLVTGDPADLGAFAIPTVYGGADPNSPRWEQGGYHATLEDFLKFKVGEHDEAEIDPALVAQRSPIFSPRRLAIAEQRRTVAGVPGRAAHRPAAAPRIGHSTALTVGWRKLVVYTCRVVLKTGVLRDR